MSRWDIYMQILSLQVFCWTNSFILNETHPCDRFSCESAKQWTCLFLEERLYFCELALFLSSEFLINECRIIFEYWKPSLHMVLKKQRTANNKNSSCYWFLSLFKKGLFFFSTSRTSSMVIEFLLNLILLPLELACLIYQGRQAYYFCPDFVLQQSGHEHNIAWHATYLADVLRVCCVVCHSFLNTQASFIPWVCVYD